MADALRDDATADQKADIRLSAGEASPAQNGEFT